ncbi:MAG TPA: ATP synthase F1 subunit delta [Mesotoga infera]|uniref:ATP synthase subunit delta n=1 Tax=Mesotoga infera TaxID=1236046 RepID=A0A7Z7LGZ1_9BACT|nr:ATP synthase F1 subunit delta [Mesotoga infera]MBP8660799.1 ATP synthase F1 subunit delta [Mesotoga sp.]SSC13701.1 ATP synthase subunit delta [Mesotoga infera]HOI34090.1 ATP synthase F1 subunit delta [Mesotoga infera]HOI63011.1 ATP synthase F1 subunit delta [Mesotoga sp.]HON27663.1 ATP synthase F1 subunit delta [Mesotoga infera]
MKRSLSLAAKYARALIESISHEKLEGVRRDLKTLSTVISSEELGKFIFDPTVAGERKEAMLLSFLSNPVDETTLLVKLLVNVKKIWLFPDILLSFEEMILERSNRVLVEVISAIPLSDEEKIEIIEKVRKMTGYEGLLESRVDESLIAGYVIKFHDEVIDASLSGRLKRVGMELGNTGSQEVI